MTDKPERITLPQKAGKEGFGRDDARIGVKLVA
jgi:hypothetical protein